MISSNVTLVANFAPVAAQYTVAVSASPSAGGTVNGGGTFAAGSLVTVTATANSNYNFVNWTQNGNQVSTSPSYQFTLNSNVTLVANFTSATSSSASIFTTQTPASVNVSDGPSVNYELGTRFQSNVAGQITAIRFWKASQETGIHTGHVWESAGNLLATATFSGETASGWQQVSLSTPLSIAANTTYVVSVNTGATFYVVTDTGFASSIVNGPLSTVVGNNGVYGSPGAFPTNTYLSSNYFRDVVFTWTPPPPDTIPPTIPTNLTAKAVSSSQINLSWTASTDNVGVAGYNVMRNGSPVGTSTTTTFSDFGLVASTTYSYTVSV
jgi:hypothetical protein